MKLFVQKTVFQALKPTDRHSCMNQCSASFSILFLPLTFPSMGCYSSKQLLKLFTQTRIFCVFNMLQHMDMSFHLNTKHDLAWRKPISLPTKLVPTIQKHIHTRKHKDNCFLMNSHYANAHHEAINLGVRFYLPDHQ